jgi:plastocyanin
MRVGHPRAFRAAVLAAAVLATVLLAACGGSGGGGGYTTGPGGQNPPPSGQPPGSTSNSILVRNNAFDPSATTVNAGTTVTWRWDTCNEDPYGGPTTCVNHSVTFADGGSATQATGSYSRTFNATGTFNYRCTQHPGMTGQVVVR